MGQVRALVALRWHMVRVRRVRLGLLALLLVLLALSLQGVIVGQTLPGGTIPFRLLLLTPTLFLVFAALSVVAPLVAGGGNELFPDGQLVAYPIRPRTVFLGSVLVAPLNLAWVTQFLVLVTTTAIITEQGPRVLLALLTTVLFMVTATVLGQAVGWFVIGVRGRPGGRTATRVAGVLLLVGSLTLLTAGLTRPVLDRAPTRYVVDAVLAGGLGRYRRWGLTCGALVLLTWVAARAGTWACSWALRQAAPVGRPELTPVARRGARGSVLSELVAVDRASVWRSTPLRRGVLVLAILPGSVSLLAHPTWNSLTLLPGLVAAGAGLLFGVNAFCLDGGGAVFVAVMPHAPRTTLLAKLLVIGQTCLAAVTIAVVLAASQLRTLPSPAEALAVLGSVVGATALVTASCGRLSVTRPHKADLRGPRDTPAPPGTMALYSLRLALSTTWPGLAFAGAGASGSWQAALAALVAVLALAGRSLLGSLRVWTDPVRRSRVVTTVAYG